MELQQLEGSRWSYTKLYLKILSHMIYCDTQQPLLLGYSWACVNFTVLTCLLNKLFVKIASAKDLKTVPTFVPFFALVPYLFVRITVYNIPSNTSIFHTKILHFFLVNWYPKIYFVCANITWDIRTFFFYHLIPHLQTWEWRRSWKIVYQNCTYSVFQKRLDCHTLIICWKYPNCITITLVTSCITYIE